MRNNILLFAILFFSITLFAQTYQGPVPPITSGYGSYGPYQVTISSFPNPTKGSDKTVSVFHPQDIDTKVPTIFYCPGFGITDYEVHLALFNFIASNGYAVVFSPYSSKILNSLDAKNSEMLNGILASANMYPDIIDTTRVGIMGHSFGAGASPWVGKNLYTNRNWGENGRFMFLNATWYLRQMDQEDLEDFPSDCKFICQVNDQDKTNDHRTSIDLFCNINIPNEEKDFIIIQQDTVAEYGQEPYCYFADHRVIKNDNIDENSMFDAYDYYSVFRLLEALAVYTFEGDLEAKNIALGNGSPEQIYMGEHLKPLKVTDTPIAQHAEKFYTSWPCSYSFLDINPRVNRCDINCYESIDLEELSLLGNISIYPNPISSGDLSIDLTNHRSLYKLMKIYNSAGNLIKQLEIERDVMRVATNEMSDGIYLIELIGNSRKTIKFIKQ